MPAAKRPSSQELHRAQIARARRFVLERLAEPLTLGAIAAQAGAAPHHFARLYHAVTHETLFAYVARARLRAAARLLVEQPEAPIGQIALDVGYQTPSALSRAFRQALGLSPSAFRRPGRDRVALLRARLGAPAAARGAERFRLSRAPRWATREERWFSYRERRGAYPEIAPVAWLDLEAALAGWTPPRGAERVGASHDDPERVAEHALRYEAGFTLPIAAGGVPGLPTRRLPGGRHAVFEHRGPYSTIAAGFDAIFRAHGGALRLRAAPCLEIYCDDPRATPEAELRTELWIPVAGRGS